VKSIKTGRTGTITETYDHNGTDTENDDGTIPKNADKYGVTFDTGRTKHAYFRVDEFYVANPLGPKWTRLMNKAYTLINHSEPIEELTEKPEKPEFTHESRDRNLERLMHPDDDPPFVPDVAFGTAGEGVIEEEPVADDDIRHMFMSTGKVITHTPEQRHTELHVGDRVKVVSGKIRVRSGEMHGYYETVDK
jgi:hypothetical protein